MELIDGTVVAPYDIALAGLSGVVIGYGLVLLSGFYPLEAARPPLAGAAGQGLVLTASGALVLLAAAVVFFVGFATAWAPALVAVGLGFLAGPPLLQAVPAASAHGTLGVALLCALEALLLVWLGLRLFG